MTIIYDEATGINRDDSRTPTGEVLYVSGGMTGFPRFNFHIFDSCEAYLLELGHGVISPAEHDRAALRRSRPGKTVDSLKGFADGTLEWYYADAGFVHEDLLGWDLKAIIDHCTGIVMLPDWEPSTGAKWERMAAEATGKAVWLAEWNRLHAWEIEPDPEQKRLSTILKAAVTA